jgi:hypothetical protein
MTGAAAGIVFPLSFAVPSARWSLLVPDLNDGLVCPIIIGPTPPGGADDRICPPSAQRAIASATRHLCGCLSPDVAAEMLFVGQGPAPVSVAYASVRSAVGRSPSLHGSTVVHLVKSRAWRSASRQGRSSPSSCGLHVALGRRAHQVGSLTGALGPPKPLQAHQDHRATLAARVAVTARTLGLNGLGHAASILGHPNRIRWS